MASVVRDPCGRKRILFVAGDGSRKVIRLGKTSQKQAEAFKIKLEALVAATFSRSMDNQTAAWIAELPNDMHAKLAAVGLVTPRATMEAQSRLALRPFLAEYIQSRSDVKLNTRLSYGRGRKHLLAFFGPDKLLSEITPGDADAWRLYLLERGLSENTCRRMCGLASQFLRAAVRRRLVPSNPFDDLKTSVKGNPEKFYFVTRQQAQRVLDACTDPEWALIFALARYGGLRCPSEILALTWQDIDWERSRFRVRSSKTEHYEGGESRMVPLFPELVPYLREVFERAEPGSRYVITRYRANNTNLRAQFQRIILSAGLEPWPKLFQNLRSTRETELTETWPQHVVIAWLGHSQAIATRHYLQVTEEHFERAAQNAAHLAQKAAQYPAALSGTVQNVTRDSGSENEILPLVAAGCGSIQDTPLGDAGIEPATR